MSDTLHLLSAGAAKGLVQALQPAFERAAGCRLAAEFGAVGAMKERLLGGAPCDVLILTEAMLAALARDGIVDAATLRPLGRVYTGIAVPAKAALPRIDTPETLRAAITRATAIYFPDPQRATAGIHFAGVLDRLGIRDAVAPHLMPYPNGANAMRALADAGDAKAIGCTQVTEILYTPGVVLAGVLPREFELATVYSVAVCTHAASRERGLRLVESIAGDAARALREQGGFVPV